ncbi:hypothetical protein TPHA_0N00190 [Tetrapisispora phaffii CBS 4417]|uniref:Uncharacterized protein n=1 Tax=Tetrapisispora phaffii (strain ATCC 24235 / CBS 4417 / NBRC 1672 / NRRL Y-8282 / UCD 70-5) TaxID=1071381 RepID=G8C0X2_TETPH|nr:hypothetical protein TPHA_0N00190 [Tetrapisispora phaffii CBS 4417]CCE65800.1 hypothetical protein TPHA_0N00190 [Tetrapisispora phaffii CBS 4417]
MSIDQSITNSTSFDSTSSKGLVDELSNFHISSPFHDDDNQRDQKKERKQFKEYKQNKDFSDSKFITHIDDDDDEYISGSDEDEENATKTTIKNHDDDYLHKLQDWSNLSVNFLPESPNDVKERNYDYSYGDGTVNRKQTVNEDQDQENINPPQWKQHMLLNNNFTPNQNNKIKNSKNLFKNPQSDLIISSSLSDISGIPTNTFKNHSGNKVYSKKTSNNQHSGTVLGGEFLDKENVDHTLNSEQDPIEDANFVFENMMKRENKMHQIPNLALNKQMEDRSSLNSNEISEYSKTEDEDGDGILNDSDPRISAHNVFNDLLKSEKARLGTIDDLNIRRRISITNNNHIPSNKNKINNANGYKNNQLTAYPTNVIEENEEEDSSYLGEEPLPMGNDSRVNFNNNRKEQGNKKSQIPLIQPEDIGYVFNHRTGAWEQPQENFAQDYSNSRTVENITLTSTNSGLIDDDNNNDISKNGKLNTLAFSNKNKTSSIQSEIADHKNQSILTEADDTSIDTPKLNPLFVVKDFITEDSRSSSGFKNDKNRISTNHKRELSNRFSRLPIQESSHIFSKGNTTVGNVTGISQISETSFHQTRSDLVSTITNVMAPIRKENNHNNKIDWNDISKIDLSNLGISSVYGMDSFLPNLIELNLSNNNINSLNGLPKSIVRLNLSNNEITNGFFELSHLPNVEELYLANNKITSLLNSFKKNCHLRKIDLSKNEITSIDEFNSISKITDINLSKNNIKGEINFQKFNIEENELNYKVKNCWSCIEELNFEANDIIKIKNLKNLKKLRVLILDNNCNLESIENNNEKQHEMGNLRYLSIQNISKKFKFNSTDAKFFLPFIRLRVLKIDSVVMTKFLETIKKQQNIENAYSRYFSNTLEILVITKNEQTTAPTPTLVNELFQYLPNTLRELSLVNFNEELMNLPINFSSSFPIVQTLNLRNNGINSLYKLISRLPLPSLIQLNLQDNPIIRNCNDSELKQIKSILFDICPNLKDLEV